MKHHIKFLLFQQHEKCQITGVQQSVRLLVILAVSCEGKIDFAQGPRINANDISASVFLAI